MGSKKAHPPKDVSVNNVCMSDDSEQTISKVTFLSWNSTGIDVIKCEYLNELMDEKEVDFCQIQEHFKTTKNTRNFFAQHFPDYNVSIKEAFRRPGTDSGRGIAGIGQLMKKDLNINKKRIVFKSPRIQGHLLEFGNAEILWINIYWPTDNRKQDTEEIINLISELETKISHYPEAKLIMGGDWNYNNSIDTAFTRVINEGLARMEAETLWNHKTIDFTYEHGKARSTIDHFMVSKELIPMISDMGVIHRGDNLSGHSPIYMTLEVNQIRKKTPVNIHPATRTPNFEKANLQELDKYRNMLEINLRNIGTPAGLEDCTNCKCKQDKHKEESDNLILDILIRMIEASYLSIPLTGSAKPNGRKTQIPGWNNECRNLRQESKYAYRVWIAAGKPNNGDIYASKQRAHSLYMQAIKKIKRNQKKYEADALLEASLKGDMNLFKEMKRIRTGKSILEDLPEEVEGAKGEQEIAEKFKEVYELLYNSAESQKEMERLNEKISMIIETSDQEPEVLKMDGSVVKEAIGRMKPHKMDISQGWTSDSLIYGPDIMFEHLATVFRSWLRHGHVTRSILACAFIPLIKSQLKDSHLCDSYRAIASSSLILKTFEQSILIIWGDKLSSDSLQFGFKRRCSTNQATWLVLETLGHFLRRGSKPIGVILDCSKAFDLAKFNIIFSELLDRGVPAIVVRVLSFSYQEQQAWVKWGRKATSSTFTIKNGTRQGSVASPSFWSIYLNPLFEKLRAAGIGCTVEQMWIGIVGYADDIILLAPTRSAAQRMLCICEEFASIYNIKYSTDEDPSKSKSKAMYVVGEKKTHLPKPEPLILCGKPLPWVETAEHLGHTLSSDGTMKQDIREKRAQFIDEAVKVRETFSYSHPEQIVDAVDKYCTTFYSSNLWDLHSKEVETVYSTWRTNLKLIWECPRATRGYLVQEVLSCGQDKISTRLLMKFKKFHASLLTSPSKEARMMVRIAQGDIRTNTGSNIRLIQEKTGNRDMSSKELRDLLRKKDTIEVPKQDFWRPRYLKKLLVERRDKYLRANSQEELQSLIDSLCIN